MHTISRRRRLAAILLLPFMLLLAGCGRIVGEFEVRNVDTMYVSLDYAIDTEVIDELGSYGTDMGSTPEEFCGLSEEQAGGFGEVTPEAYEEDGMWGCRIEGVVERADFGSGIELTEEDGELHFVLEGSGTDLGADMSLLGFDELEFNFTISFPGKVIESANGTVDGNSVVFTDINEFSQGVDIRAEAGGFPWIIVIIAVVVIGFFLLLIVAAAAFFFLRSRNKKNSGMTSSASAAPAAPAAFGASAGSPGFGQYPPAAPQQSSPAAPPQGSPLPPQQSAPEQGQPWGQPSPAAPQQPGSEPQWGQQPQAPQQPPQAPQQPQAPQEPQAPQAPQAPQQNDPWAQPGQDPQQGQQWNQQPPPPQNPGW
ncbi:MAG TPA: hypothetical protein H9837_03635 [Candidatus Brachybacterium merdigallinarum]|nr:hypothetical protein [Candidatus Brachybacterium merdigallinarum]